MITIRHESDYELSESEKAIINVEYVAYGKNMGERAYVTHDAHERLAADYLALQEEFEKSQAMYAEAVNVLMSISKASTQIKGMIAVIESYTGEEV